MDRDQGNTPSSGRDGWVQEQLSALRKALAAGRWPESADRLLADLSATPAETEGDDLEMLSLAINDALDGVDIAAHYPNFYRRLLADTELRNAFLDALAILDPEDLSDGDAFPPAPSLDMPFLEEEILRPLVENIKEGWRILWQRSIPQLERLFGIPPGADTGSSALAEPKPVWRGPVGATPGPLDEGTLPLLRDRVQLGQQEVEVFLEATRASESSEHLDATLIVAGFEAARQLQVTVHWGTYQESMPVPATGFVRLPTVPLDRIFDENGISALQLELVVT